jgi:hypothetical protein
MKMGAFFALVKLWKYDLVELHHKLVINYPPIFYFKNSKNFNHNRKKVTTYLYIHLFIYTVGINTSVNKKFPNPKILLPIMKDWGKQPRALPSI